MDVMTVILVLHLIGFAAPIVGPIIAMIIDR